MLRRSGLEEKALGLLEKYLKLHKAPDAYDAGDLLALWYALQWRKSGKKPNVVGKVALVLLKSSHMKVVVDDEGTELDAGVTSWDKDILKTVTVPDVMRDWRLFSDAMCFLNDSTGSTFSVGFEPILVEDCWEVLTKAQNPLWDSKYKRCISHTDFGTPEFMSAVQKWEEGYVKAGVFCLMALPLLSLSPFCCGSLRLALATGSSTPAHNISY